MVLAVNTKTLTRKFFQRAGREGGLKAARQTTAAERRLRGLKGMQSRWSKRTDEDLLALLPQVRGLVQTAQRSEG